MPAGELERSLSRYAAAISVFMWFERKPNSEDLPLRSVALSMPPDKRARAEQAIAEAMAGAGLACLESEQPDEAIYAASTALRLGGSTSLRASAIYLRARANIQRGTAQTLSRARDDLSSLIETLQSDDSAGNEAGHECPALEDVQAALAAVEEELRECKEREREVTAVNARRGEER